MEFPTPSNELQRLAALHDLSILDSPREAGFDELVNLTREMFGVKAALISLIDRDRQWFKATSGLDLCETSRETAFCNYTICSDEPFIVADARQDDRFRKNPLVLNDPKIRLYAGVPLSLESGINLGTLCVIDPESRHFTPAEIGQLRRLGNLAQSLLQQFQTSRRATALWASSVEQIKTISNQALDLKKQKRLLDCASTLARLGAWERDVDTDELEWSDGLYQLHEVERDNKDLLQNHFHLYPEPERSQIQELMASSRAANKGFTFEGRMYTAKGNLRWVRIVSDVEIVDGQPVRRFGMKQDITEQKLLSAQVEHLVFCDDLTGMNNRRGLRKRLAELDGQRIGLLNVFLFDLDGFKDINDNHGHSAGDACLRRVARRVKSMLPSDDVIARVGGDEFVVISEASGLSVDSVADIIQTAVSRPIVWRGQTFSLSCSIGIASRSNVTVNPDEVIREADLALYEAKADGRACHRQFRNELKINCSYKRSILSELREALTSQRLELYYQPKVSMLDGSVVGFEALLRLNRIGGDVAVPGEFMPALEDPALSKEIGRFVVTAALNQAAEWSRVGINYESIAINLSASQFHDATFAEDFLGAIAARGLSAHSIEVEVTEGVFLSAASNCVLSACRTLRKGGVRIAFDDFGTGFASLTHLRDFPVDVLKIDRSFIQELTAGGTTTTIVNAMVALANDLSISVVAEGVETEHQARFLKAIGCKIAQGYLFSKPMSSSKVADFLAHRVQGIDEGTKIVARR